MTSLRPDEERVTTIIVPARTMASIDSSELVDDEAPNYFAAGESVAPTATKTVATGRPTIDANTLRERIGRNRRDILRELLNKPLAIHLHTPRIRLAIAFSPR
jgi:hypothetical protein